LHLTAAALRFFEVQLLTSRCRSADCGRSRGEGVGDGIISGEESSHNAEAPSGWPKGGHHAEAARRGRQHTVRHPDALL
jgi:hypothetical protein